MKLTLEKHQQVFFTSDTHFHHSNICSGATRWKEDRGYRPFDSLEEMDKAIVDSINSVVGPDDILFHLGDWSFGGIEQIYELKSQLQCRKIHFFLGNHDHHIENNRGTPQLSTTNQTFTLQGLFSSINKLENVQIKIPRGKDDKGQRLKHKRLNFVLSHFPIASWDRMKDGVMHLHGHIHTPHSDKVGPGRMMDVGMDGHPEFRPYSLDEVLELLKDQPIKGLLQHKHDHHGGT